jgi:hypothetical protein
MPYLWEAIVKGPPPPPLAESHRALLGEMFQSVALARLAAPGPEELPDVHPQLGCIGRVVMADLVRWALRDMQTESIVGVGQVPSI